MSGEGERPDPVTAARAVVDERFPDALCAFVASSVLRGEGTATSDLDLVVVVVREEAPFRESFFARGWPVEAFVHTITSYRRFFTTDVQRRRPSLVTMCAEGKAVRDQDGLAARIKEEARALLEAGPAPLTRREIEAARYRITDLLDDLIGCDDPREGVFIAHDLAEAAANLILDLNGHWQGGGKWTPRAMRRFDPDRAGRLTDALLAYCRVAEKSLLILFAEEALRPAGGRLFDGYHLPAPKDP